jgi:hypothetical protein
MKFTIFFNRFLNSGWTIDLLDFWSYSYLKRTYKRPLKTIKFSLSLSSNNYIIITNVFIYPIPHSLYLMMDCISPDQMPIMFGHSFIYESSIWTKLITFSTTSKLHPVPVGNCIASKQSLHDIKPQLSHKWTATPRTNTMFTVSAETQPTF